MDIGPRSLLVRRAETFLARLKGLLLAPPLPPGEGLLLVPCNSVHTAFMRHPIDVVFLDRAGVIRRIVSRLKPWRMAICFSAHQTLELAAGEAERLGLVQGESLAGCLTPCLKESSA